MAHYGRGNSGDYPAASFRSIAKRIAYRASVLLARVAWATLDLESTWFPGDKELTRGIGDVLCNRRNMLAMAELMVTMDRNNRKESIAALTKIAKTFYADRGFDPAVPIPDSQSAMFKLCKYMKQGIVIVLCLHKLGRTSAVLLKVWLIQTQQKSWLQALKPSALTLTQSHETSAEVYQVSLRAYTKQEGTQWSPVTNIPRLFSYQVVLQSVGDSPVTGYQLKASAKLNALVSGNMVPSNLHTSAPARSQVFDGFSYPASSVGREFIKKA